MELYRVVNIKIDYDNSCQILDLVGLNDNAMSERANFCVDRLFPLFRVGAKLRVYTSWGIADDLPIDVAYGYRLQGRTFVDVKKVPNRQGDVIAFYENIHWWAAKRLKRDVVRALRTQKIRPTLNAANNLRLLLFNPAAPIKTL